MADTKSEVKAVRAVVNYDRSTIVDEEYDNYNIVLTELSPEAVAQLTAWGVEVKETEGVYSLKCRSKFPMKVFQDNKEWTGRMGNGTVVKARLAAYTIEKGKFEGKRAVRVQTMDILELVERTDSDADDGVVL